MKYKKTNKLTILENVVSLELTQGKTTLVDKEDLDKIKEYNWYAKRIPKYKDHEVYHAMAGAKNEYGKNTTVSLHRIIMDAPRGMTVDHINRDTLDNRKANLRLATQSQNSANKGKDSNNTSGYTGVCRDGDLWRAQLGYQDKQYFLGRFNTKEEAARAYDREKIKRFGQFAKTNGMEHWFSKEEKEMAKKLKMSPEELFFGDTEDE